MKCLDEGTLQSYLDRELPEAQMSAAAGHLNECAVCRCRLDRLEAAMTSVHALLDVLECNPHSPIGASLPGRRRWQWVAAGVAVAASIALFLAVARPRTRYQAAPYRAVTLREPSSSAASVAPRRAAPYQAARYRAATVRKRSPLRRQPPAAPDNFVALDSDPIQIGMVVRVMLPVSDASLTGGPHEVAADLIIGEDGRARAFRLVE